MGVRMSGAPSCASIEPSTYSTSEWTMLSRWITTSTCCGVHAEQQAGLDELEPLVHERGGIDRDLAAHDPVRMRAGLIGRDALEARAIGVEERTARGGQQDAFHARRRFAAARVARQALEHRVVFAVDGQQRGARRRARSA